MDNYNDMLDKCGQFLIGRVRDRAIEHWEKVMAGSMNDMESKGIFKSLSTFTPEQMKLVRSLLPGIVDSALHYLLCGLEEEEDIKIVVRHEGQEQDINQVSDGLAGELYTEDGWIHRFSKHK